MTRRYDRRAFLRHAGAASATAAAAALAGCTSGATDGDGGNGDGGNGGGGNDGTDSGGSGGASDNVVEMTDTLEYVPKTLTVPVGTTVTWKNVGRMPHSVTAYEEKIPDGADYFASGGFDSEERARKAYPAKGKIAAEERYEHTFEVPGAYEYFCIPHEATNMVGTVKVTE